MVSMLVAIYVLSALAFYMRVVRTAPFAEESKSEDAEIFELFEERRNRAA
jgi:hypothetical protein